MEDISIAEQQDVAESRGPHPRRVALVLRVAAAVVAATTLYVALSIVAPRSVPRSVLLPRPAEAYSYYEECDGQPNVRVTESWRRSGLFWSLTVVRVGGGCPAT